MNFYLNDIFMNSASKCIFNKMKQYFIVNSIKKNLIYSKNILTAWWMIESQYSTVAQMTKNILVISFHKIEIECVFNLEYDICIYHWNHLHENIIKKIMKLKVTHQKKMIDEWLSLNAELKKKTMKNLMIMKKEKNCKIIIFEKNKLIQNCHFDHFDKISKRKRKLTESCIIISIFQCLISILYLKYR